MAVSSREPRYDTVEPIVISVSVMLDWRGAFRKGAGRAKSPSIQTVSGAGPRI